ncbi:hypothetical protein EHQ68_13095 [Leptospira congkakensis]|uniref:Uncharacterized protein n=1 Tax=Leptospira congkakensis TaxID=2484932 RepID=A0A4Z1A5T6_9LEPT|nr:hypothetical protein [Leptospira congkakensis]TGL86262.1 hypothetical protein EHQ68_13095 [Leptospira congkakensis]TGL94193.1 hypothetical protein EHQ69_06935 [Leptospira congkakensis]TGL94398.1 hypothetical protein EHQ70_13855 [Leptospira congkakensis]
MWNPSPKTRTIASKILILLFSFTTIFHILALLQIVPFQYLWGGRLSSVEEMYVMESVSLIVTIFFLWASFLYIQYLNKGLVPLWIRLVFAFIGIIFLANTIGNLVAVTDLETLLATPVTAILSGISFSLVPKYENKTS